MPFEEPVSPEEPDDGTYDVPKSTTHNLPYNSPRPSIHVEPDDGTYDVPKSSTHNLPYTKASTINLPYNPPRRNLNVEPDDGTYDVPKSSMHNLPYNSPRPSRYLEPDSTHYDVPKSPIHKLPYSSLRPSLHPDPDDGTYDTPKSSMHNLPVFSPSPDHFPDPDGGHYDTPRPFSPRAFSPAPSYHSDTGPRPSDYARPAFVSELLPGKSRHHGSSRSLKPDSPDSPDHVPIQPIKMTNCIARAMYDNVAESPDELAFKRNDVLTVLEQNTAGLEGWWLCSLRGRQGICPGNRLRIMPGVYDTGSGMTTLSTLSSPASNPTTPSRPSATSPAARTQAPRSNKVVTPRRVGDVYTYDTPRTLTHNQQAAQFDYDIPPTKHAPHDSGGARLSRSSSLRYDSPRPHVRSSLDQYDIPRSQYDSPKVRPLYDSPKSQQHYDSPRSHQDSHRVGSGPRSLIKGVRGGAPPTVQPASDINQEYDVPRPTNSNQEAHFDMQPSDRSSGVSVMSCDSSQLSTSSSASSLAASESPSLSSLGGSSNRSSLESHDVYDIPPEPRKVGGSQRPKLPPRESKDSRDAYDVPRSIMAVGGETYDTPPSRTPRSLAMRVGGEGVYDVPPQVCRDVRQPDCTDSAPNRLSSGSDSSGGEVELNFGKELHLEYDSALDTLTKLQQEVYGVIEKLTIVHQNVTWRGRETVEEREEDLKIVVFRLNKSVHELLDFGRGSAATAARRGERGVARRLQHLTEPVAKSLTVIEDCLSRLQGGAWRQALTCGTTPENLNLLAVTTRSLVEDVRILASTIHTKASFIFKKSPAFDVTASSRQQTTDDDEKTPVQERPLPDLPQKSHENMYENDARTWLEDYDYVNLETRESMEREHEDIKKELPAELRKSFDNLVKQSQLIVDSDHEKALRKFDSTSTVTEKRSGNVLDPNDRQVINFYGNQAEVHLQHLNTAIDAFLLTIENNQPPKVFIAHSKFVILNAHKLVYIGDTVHRNVVNADVRTRVLNCSNALCDAMKNTVSAAKTAALQFPSVVAVQAMVDAFVSVSHLANNLKQAVSVNNV